MRKILLLSVAAIALSMGGCSTLDSLEPGRGQSFTVNGPTFDQVWHAVNQGVASRLTLVESNQATGTVKAQSGVGLTTWGEVVGVFVQPPQPGSPSYNIEVLSLKRSRGQITGTDWTNTVTESIKAELLRITYQQANQSTP